MSIFDTIFLLMIFNPEITNSTLGPPVVVLSMWSQILRYLYVLTADWLGFIEYLAPWR